MVQQIYSLSEIGMITLKVAKIMNENWIEDVSDIKLIRTNTTLDLSQNAEKRLQTGTLCSSKLYLSNY